VTELLLRHLLGVTELLLRHLLGVTELLLRHLPGVTELLLRHLLGVTELLLRHLLGVTGSAALIPAQVGFALPIVDGAAIAFVLGDLCVAQRVVAMVADRSAHAFICVERVDRLP